MSLPDMFDKIFLHEISPFALAITIEFGTGEGGYVVCMEQVQTKWRQIFIIV
jgi:hypothetical protein